jgi:hypothetical protein
MIPVRLQKESIMKARIVLALVVILVLVMAGSASAAATGGRTAPFKATIETYPRVVGMLSDPPVIALAIPGQGQCTIDGRFLSHTDECTWYADSWVLFGYPYNHQWGVMTFTAANGDQLLGTFEGEGYFDPVLGTNSFWGTYVITGGTGKLAGAQGAGVYWGTAVEGPPGEAGLGTLNFDGALTR